MVWIGCICLVSSASGYSLITSHSTDQLLRHSTPCTSTVEHKMAFMYQSETYDEPPVYTHAFHVN